MNFTPSGQDPLSKSPPLRPRMAPRSIYSFAIVASQFNLEFTQALVDNAARELALLEQGSNIQISWVPGSFEIPVLAKILASQGKFDAILAFGVLFEGETAHAQLVAQAVTNGLQQIAIERSVPVLDGVLLLSTPDQARERCHGMEINRGIEAARAAVSIARSIREITAK